MSSQTIWQLAKKLYLIALMPPLQGFDRFIGIWLHTAPPAFLVDVGPAATSASLLKALADTETDDLPHVCLERLLCEDARLAAYAATTKQERNREEGFLRNSTQGFIGYLQRTPVEASVIKQQTPHQPC